MIRKEEKLIEKVFLSSLAAFSLSMLTSSLGSLVDGLIIGNTMDTQCIAAFGLINPLNITFALIGSILDSGMSNSCAKALGENDPEQETDPVCGRSFDAGRRLRSNPGE